MSDFELHVRTRLGWFYGAKLRLRLGGEIVFADSSPLAVQNPTNRTVDDHLL